MSRRPRPTFALFAFLALVGIDRAGLAQAPPPGETRALGFDPVKLDRIGAMLREHSEAGRIAGGSALVARHGRLAGLYLAGMRDLEAGKPMAPDTIVRIASMTKPITSAAVMMLVDDGKIKLDDPVSKFIPEFKDPRVLVGSDPNVNPPATRPAGREITIHHLLTHTSGLAYRFANKPILSPLYATWGVSDGLSETPGTIGDNARRIAAQPLLFPPGDAWEYSLSIDVLGRVVEVASGRTLDEFFRERIFGPLRMPDTHFLLPLAKRDRLAAVYQPGAGGKVERTSGHPVQAGGLVYSPTYPTWDHGTYYSGGAGLVSTLGDYARFLQMLLNKGELDGVRVLKPETVALMTSNRIGDLPMPDAGHGDRFGYGFGVVSKRGNAPEAVGSFSWGGFFYTYFWADPDRDLIGILFTQTFPNVVKIREEFKRMTYEALAEDKDRHARRAREVTEHIQANLYDPETGVYFRSQTTRKPDYVWLQSVEFSNLVAAARAEPATYGPILKKYFNALDAYWDAKVAIPGYEAAPTKGNGDDKYYDDNAWLVITFLEAYESDRDPRYLDRADETLKFVLSGWDEEGGGGIWWHQKHKDGTKNACSNGPSAVGCLRLAKFRPDQAAALVERAKKIVDWTVGALQDQDGLFDDRRVVATGEVKRGKLTYNSALILRAMLGLYRATGQSEYLEQAKRIGKAADWFLDAKTGIYRDAVRYAHFMVEADLALYRVTKEDYLLERARRNVDSFYDRWKAKPPEDLISNAAIARVLWLMAEAETEAGRAFWESADRPGK